MDLTTLEAQDVRLAPLGMLYTAPEGTPLPLDVDEPLNAAFRGFGYITEDGVEITPGQDWNAIRMWQSAVPVKHALQEASFTIGFSAGQVEIPVLEAYFASEFTNEGSGLARMDLVSNPNQIVRATVLDWQDDEGDLYRLVIPRSQVTDRESLQLQRSEAKVFGMTLEALDSPGNIFGYLLTDAPQLVPSS